MTHPTPQPPNQLPRLLPKRRRLLPYVKPARDRNPIGVALIGLLLIALLLAAAYRADRLPVIGGGTTYSAYFTEAAGLKSGQEVRVAGVKIGKVTSVKLAPREAKVKVEFRVKDAWIGNATTATIMIKTLLGSKYLALDPLGYREQDPDEPIGIDRTVSPYDVTKAFDELGQTVEDIDSQKVGESLTVVSQAFSGTPAHFRTAIDGLSALSRTISKRDAQLAELLNGTRRLSGTIASQNDQFRALLKDGNLLLAELQRRREAISSLLVGIIRMSREIERFIDESGPKLSPLLDSLDAVTDVLKANQRNLDKALSLAGPYIRLVANASGNGRWVDGYLCGAVPKEYVTDPKPANYTAPDKCTPTRKGGR
ncbi:MCE family protein [Spirillospora sp. NPDC048911]|uniref:MCE family protein n=1 Tax=Spirillospora sp. NPDC048911 TaxID=3364527 RepID=UPI003722F7C2